MIVFVIARGYTPTHKAVSEAARGRIDVRLMNYRALFDAEFADRATYVFMDFDRLSGPDLITAGVLFRILKAANVRVLNDPALIRSRYGLLRLLARRGINDFDAYRLEEVGGPERWPVFLRCISGHSQEATSDLCFDRDQLNIVIRQALARGYPVADLLIVEYAGEEVQPGLFRKLSTFRIGPNFFAASNVHDKNWIAKHGVSGIATPELYQDELRIVRDNPYREALAEVFQLSNIEYGRADYGFFKGRPQIFEINTKPTTKFPTTHPAPERLESYRIFRANYLDALEAIDTPDGARIALKPRPPNLAKLERPENR